MTYCAFKEFKFLVYKYWFQQWTEAATLYEQGGYYDKAASVYIRAKNWYAIYAFNYGSVRYLFYLDVNHWYFPNTVTGIISHWNQP